MNVKWVFGALAGAIALATLWRVGHSSVAAMLANDQPPPKAVVFDNGSVRDLAQPASGAASAVAQQLPLKGGMRKCVRRTEVVYTDRPCPHGMSEADIDKSRFNLVDNKAR